MKLATIDKKRRLVMPKDCPPGSRATVEQVDKLTWVVRVQAADVRLKLIAVPIIERLPKDPEWDKRELKIARAIRRLKPEVE